MSLGRGHGHSEEEHLGDADSLAEPNSPVSQRTGAVSIQKAALLGISAWHHASSREGSPWANQLPLPAQTWCPQKDLDSFFCHASAIGLLLTLGHRQRGLSMSHSLSISASLSFCHICYICGMLRFHRPRHTWGSAHLSTRCVCSQNRKSVIPSSILTNKAWSKFVTLNPKLGEESHSFWKVPSTLLIPHDSDFESLFWKQSWAHGYACLLSAYSSQVSGSKGSIRRSTSPLQGPHTTRKAMG